MDKEIITLMMVTYNRLNLTIKTIEGLLERTNCDFNLVIIDNASTDGTIEYLKLLKPSGCIKNIYITYNQENKGIAIGRNQALKAANDLNTVWYSTIDNDVILPNNWLSDCIGILRVNKSYGMIGVNLEKEQFPIIEVNGGYKIQNKQRGNLGTACTVFNKSFHKMLGFFNTEYGLYGEEDADMGMRARAVGFKLGYLKENGIHLGEGEYDVGEYKDFKTRCHKDNLGKFNKNSHSYFNKKKSFYIHFKGE
jgi:GT2 family glycosyltransferase